MLERRQSEVSVARLTFPFQLLILILTVVGPVVVTQLATNYGLRSDIHDLSTRLDLQSQLSKERAESMKSDIDAIKRQLELQKYETQAVKEMVLQMKGAKR